MVICFCAGILFYSLNLSGDQKLIFQIDHTQFEIDFPSQPQREDLDVSETVKTSQYSAKGNDGGYVLVISTYNPVFSKGEEGYLISDNKSFLDSINRKLPTEERFTVSSSSLTAFNGHQSRIDEAENKDVKVRYIVFTNEVNQYYVLAYSSLKRSFDDNKWNSYIKSFASYPAN